MPWKRLAIVFVFLTCAAPCALSAECSNPPPKSINLDLWSTGSLPSPDQLWKFTSVGPNSSERRAALYIEDARVSRKWFVGSIERDGTVFWSDDSKYVFLRDEYAADDTNIRV